MKNLNLQFGLLRSRLFQEPFDPEPYSHLMLITELHGDNTATIALYQELLDSYPYAHLAWFHLGHCHWHNGDAGAALEAFEYAFCARPDFEAAYFAYAELALASDSPRQALSVLLDLYHRNEGANADCLIHLASCYLQIEDHASAEKHLRECLRLNPLHAEAQYLMGVRCAAEQDYRAAARFLRQAVRSENRREDFHQALAEVYARLGKDKLALQHYRRAIDLSPDEPHAWLKMAAHLLNTGDTRSALELLREAREYTAGPQLDYCCAACLFLLNQRQEAIPLLRSALAKDRSRLDEFFRWAPALSSDDDVRQAIEA